MLKWKYQVLYEFPDLVKILSVLLKCAFVLIAKRQPTTLEIQLLPKGSSSTTPTVCSLSLAHKCDKQQCQSLRF